MRSDFHLSQQVNKPFATRQDRSAKSEANPASFRDLLLTAPRLQVPARTGTTFHR